MLDKIVIDGMEFYGFHGVLPEEKSLGQKFVVDLKLYLELSLAGNTDDLTKTINYAEVFNETERIVVSERYDLIERLAEKIAEKVLADFPVYKVTVRVKKPQAPIKGNFNFVAVEITRGGRGPI